MGALVVRMKGVGGTEGGIGGRRLGRGLPAVLRVVLFQLFRPNPLPLDTSNLIKTIPQNLGTPVALEPYLRSRR